MASIPVLVAEASESAVGKTVGFVAGCIGAVALEAITRDSDKGKCDNEPKQKESFIPAAGSGGSKGGSGGGGGGGSDDSGDEDTDAYKEIKKKSTDVRKSDSNIQYVRVGNTKYWLSRDKAGHAGSYCKVYEEKGNNLHLRGSVPRTIFKGSSSKGNVNRILKDGVSLEDFDIMSSKHESRGGMQVSLSDLHRIK